MTQLIDRDGVLANIYEGEEVAETRALWAGKDLDDEGSAPLSGDGSIFVSPVLRGSQESSYNRHL